MSQMHLGLASLPIYSLPGVCGGAPMIAYGIGVQVRHVIQRLDAGDDLEAVASDFGVPPSTLSLLLALRTDLTTLTADEAHAAILTGRTVRVVVGPDPEDPVCLHYIDRCAEDDYEPMIYTESVGGWSEGVKEAVCEPEDSFYVGFLYDPPPLRIEITEEAPPQRESRDPLDVGDGS